jgi:biopolymer transport protein ExbD
MPTAAPTAEKQPKETAAVFAALAVGDQEGDDSLPPMSFSDPDRDEDDGMDMTPMVDVTFLLLIFFMLTATFAMQKSLDMPAPDNNEAVSQSRTIEEIEEDDEYIIVRIDEDSRIWVEDAQPPSKQELLSLLRKLIEKPLDGATKPPNKLFVMANGNARHEKVVEALDAGAALGLEDVRLTTTEEDEF